MDSCFSRGHSPVRVRPSTGASCQDGSSHPIMTFPCSRPSASASLSGRSQLGANSGGRLQQPAIGCGRGKRKVGGGENIPVRRVQCCQWCRWPASFSMKSSVHDWVGDKTSTSRGFILKGVVLHPHPTIPEKSTVKTVTFLNE